jgi:hypothetical protein
VAEGDRGDALVALYRAYAPRIHRLGLPVGTVRSRTYYALRAPRLELEERGLVA